MQPEHVAALRDAAGQRALEMATEHDGADPLAASAAVRAAGVAPDLAAAALTQVDLRRRARRKFGADAARMFFTRAGLEQATRSPVAVRRAQRLRSSGVARLADLGCGIGSDAIAAARAGMSVVAVDNDPLTAAVAEANMQALGLSDRVRVECADATSVDLSACDGVFCDPARRRGSGKRVFEPRAYSPPWEFVAALPRQVPRTVLKLAPGIDHSLIPTGAEAEWVSAGGDLVEAAFWCGPLAQVPRRATLLRGDEVHELSGAGDSPAPVGPVRRYLHDPDPAVIRSYLLGNLAAAVNGNLADGDIAYLYTDEPAASPFTRCLEVTETMPFSLKRLRALLRARQIGRVEILKRGSALDPDALRRDLRLSGSEARTLVLTRVSGAQTVLLCRPVLHEERVSR